jgi:2-(1,2-epoxy-1,2-dihydrophenyl)acetyl-CoA isomerase
MGMDFVSLETFDDVAFLRLNDPPSLNALSPPVASELIDRIAAAQHEARCIIIGSTGRAFSSGANLADDSLDMANPDRDVGAGVESLINPLILAIQRSRVPIITAIRGAAAGVGCGLALAGDLVVAGTGAYFFLAFSHVGLSPDAGASFFLTHALGRVRATELMLFGAKVPASQALEWGLVNRVVPDEEVDGSALELARRVAGGPRSLGLIRQAAWAALDQTLEEQLALERRFQREAGRTLDFVEGVAAFKDRRSPIFRGR